MSRKIMNKVNIFFVIPSGMVKFYRFMKNHKLLTGSSQGIVAHAPYRVGQNNNSKPKIILNYCDHGSKDLELILTV